MSSQKWTEKEIEEQLKQLPEMTDHRSATDILVRLKEDERFQQVPQRRRRTTTIWLSVAIVAIVLISFTLPSILNRNATQFDQAADLVRDDEVAVKTKDQSANSTEAHVVHLEEKNSYVVQESALEDYVNVQLDLLSDEQMIPISLLVPVTRIQADFPNEQPTSLQLYEKYAQNISKEALSFTPDAIIHSNETMQVHERLVSGIEQGNLVHEEQELSETQGVYSYYAYTNSVGQSYLVKEIQAGSTVVEALENMRKSPSDQVQSLISEAYPYEVVIENDVAHIQFTKELDLLSIDEVEAYRLIEGFMLTAASFHVAVQFNNVSPLYLGQYDLSEPLPKPIGSNPVYLLEE